MIKAIISLLENEKLATELGNNAKEEVVKNYEINKVLQFRADKYNIILGNSNINEITK